MKLILSIMIITFSCDYLFLHKNFQRWEDVSTDIKNTKLAIEAERRRATHNQEIHTSLVELMKTQSELYDFLQTKPTLQTLSASVVTTLVQSGMSLSRLSLSPAKNFFTLQAVGHYPALLTFINALNHHPWPLTLSTLSIQDKTRYSLEISAGALRA